MQRSAFFESISPLGKLLLLFGLIILFTIITAFGGLLIGAFYLQTDMMGLSELLAKPESDKIIAFTKFFQIVNQLGAFVLPVLLFAFLVSKSSGKYLRINKKPLSVSVLIALSIVFIVLPFLNYITQINLEMKFPDSLSWLENWMIEKEEQAKILTEAFLQTKTIWGLLLNIFIVALVPAIAEELLFRGVLLRLFKEMFKNVHAAVIISAIVFSLFHLQFFGFLPRMFLGLILGYLFVYTNNLWVPIAYHFVNNAASVIIYFLYDNKQIQIPVEDFGATNNYFYIISSLILSIGLIVIIKQRESYLNPEIQ